MMLNGERADWIISPEILLPDTEGFYYLTLDLAYTNYLDQTPRYAYDDIFAIIISPDNGQTWSSQNTLALWDNRNSPRVLHNISNTGETLTFRLRGYSGSVRLGFYGQSIQANGDNYIHIDNIKIWHSDVDVLPPDTGTKLLGNYPNPFNPETQIHFSLLKESNVKINIYNIKGQKVKSLLNETLNFGEYNYTWNGKDDHNRQLSSGIYFYQMITNDYKAVKKMLLLK